jgi:outer membrane protein assembly factor BamB
MFGLTELTVLSDESFRHAIIPTVVLPIAVLGMVLKSIATWVAAFFGYKLKSEGPRRLVELLLKPRVIVASVLLNACFYAGVIGYKKLQNSSWPILVIELRNKNVKESVFDYRPMSKEAGLANKVLGEKHLSKIELIWTTKVTGGIFGGITLTNSSLIFGTSKGYVYELEKSSGQVFRQFVFGQPIMTQPIVFNEHMFFGEGVHDTFNAKFISIDLKLGKFSSSIQTTGHIERTAKLIEFAGQSYMIVSAGRDGLYAIDPNTMKVLWRAKIGHIDGIPFVEKNRIYVGTGMEAGDKKQVWTKVYSINLLNGEVLHEKEVATSAFGAAFAWSDSICFSLGDVYETRGYGQIACYNKENLEETAAINVGGALIANALLQGDYVFVADFKGVIYKINLATSRIENKVAVPVGDVNYAPLVMTGANEIALPGKEGLYFFSMDSLKLIYSWKPPIENWKGAYDNLHIENDNWYWADRVGNVFSLRPKYSN